MGGAGEKGTGSVVSYEFVRRQARQPRQVDFLFRQIVLERDDSLSLGERLNLGAIKVGLRDDAGAALFKRLSIKGVGGLQLSARRVQPRFRRDRLKICAADGQRDQVFRVLGGFLVGAHDLFGRTVVFPGRHVHHLLVQSRAKIEEVEGADDGRY